MGHRYSDFCVGKQGPLSSLGLLPADKPGPRLHAAPS